jgi:hypothetical protein
MFGQKVSDSSQGGRIQMDIIEYQGNRFDEIEIVASCAPGTLRRS